MVRSLIALSFALVAVANSGCVLEPLNEGEIRNHVTRVRGYFPYPNEDIWIQAWNSDMARWDTIGHARSRHFGFQTGWAPFPGSDSFYAWDAGFVHVPHHLFMRGPEMISGEWVVHHSMRGIVGPQDQRFCVLRAIHSGGQVLASYYEQPNVGADPVEEWRQHGSRDAWFILYESD